MAGQNSSRKGQRPSALASGGSSAPSQTRRHGGDGTAIAAAEPAVRHSDGRNTSESVTARLQTLEEMDCSALRAEWRRFYHAHPPKRVSRDLLMLGVAWKIQEQAYGGLGAATRRRIADLDNAMKRDGDITRSRVVRLKPGAKLVREWRGDTHTVVVLEDGFEWKSQRWRSLSVIAREITGGHWSGPRFFGLKERARTNTEGAVAETGDA